MGAEQIGVRAYAGAMCRVRMGILGGGQLGRMLALAAHELGVQTRCWDQREDAVAGHVGGLHVDDFQKPARLDVFLRGVDVVTTEWENVPVALLEEIERRGVPVRPGSLALRVAQDRVREKNLARSLGIPTPAFVAAVTLGELEGAVREVGLPCVVKTRRFGYDGKGQVVVRKAEEVAACWGALGATAGGLIVEGFVPFARQRRRPRRRRLPRSRPRIRRRRPSPLPLPRPPHPRWHTRRRRRGRRLARTPRPLLHRPGHQRRRRALDHLSSPRICPIRSINSTRLLASTLTCPSFRPARASLA